MIFGDYSYSECVLKIEAFDKKSFLDALDVIEKKRSLGYWVGYMHYEAYKLFFSDDFTSIEPLLYFKLFKKRERLELEQKNNKKFFPKILNKQSFFKYKKNIEKIKKAIKKGDTYQTNYTYKIDFETKCLPQDVFFNILENQHTEFSAYISNEHESILSFSPELFFEISNNVITAKPMKGTINRGDNFEEDENNKDFLRSDIKNRSENVMIVDLLRNDLSRISSKVEVEELFRIVTLKTVHQMISVIKAELRHDIKITDILKALFPCGSITGAPKIKTMEIIEKLEQYKRGVYCGMIGVIDKDSMLFSVPIRTLVYKKGAWSLCVGSGIVWDSDAYEEYQESLLKSKFIYPNVEFELVETMLIKKGKILSFALHKKRLFQSARYFNFNKPELKISKPLKDGILRLRVNKKGEVKQEFMELNKNLSNRIVFSEREEKNNDFLYHKTTYAPWYEEARAKILRNEIFDCIFYNEDFELAEGARSNIVLQIDGRLYTPRIESGILNGIMRQKMLKSKKIEEKQLFLHDIKRAQKIFCINSIRGVVEVVCDSNY